jgi:hypothetical protein
VQCARSSNVSTEAGPEEVFVSSAELLSSSPQAANRDTPATKNAKLRYFFIFFHPSRKNLSEKLQKTFFSQEFPEGNAHI